MTVVQFVLTLLVSLGTGAVVSLGISALARFIFLRRIPAKEREQVEEVEETMRVISSMRRRRQVPTEEMQRVLARVVRSSMTESGGRRTIRDLEKVEVKEPGVSKEALLESAERALRARFAAEAVRRA